VSAALPQTSPTPADLKELTALCRAGKLFAVQDWLDRGQRYLTTAGARGRTPLDVALDTGSTVSLKYSFVQEYLRKRSIRHFAPPYSHGVSSWRSSLLSTVQTRTRSRLEDVFDTRSPELIRWVITLGLDLETRWPIARVFENRQRECLGIYMDLRDRVPSARRPLGSLPSGCLE
jgi:hypothetical protein